MLVLFLAPEGTCSAYERIAEAGRGASMVPLLVGLAGRREMPLIPDAPCPSSILPDGVVWPGRAGSFEKRGSPLVFADSGGSMFARDCGLLSGNDCSRTQISA